MSLLLLIQQNLECLLQIMYGNLAISIKVHSIREYPDALFIKFVEAEFESHLVELLRAELVVIREGFEQVQHRVVLVWGFGN